MFDLSLLIGLPKPNSLDTSSLTPEDAAIKLRQAATLRLNGAQSILLHFPQDVELAVELLDDAAVLYDKAFRNLTGIQLKAFINRSMGTSLFRPQKGLPRSKHLGAMSSLR